MDQKIKAKVIFGTPRLNPAQKALQKNNKTPHILIIEDESDISIPLKVRFHRLGFRVTSVVDGEDGLAKALMIKPDLVLLDLLLPKLSGENVCKAIKESNVESIRSIPIIMMSAKDGEADQILGRVIGANAYVTKPFEFETLLKLVGKFMCGAHLYL